MQKLLKGCLVVLVLGAIVLGVGAYFAYRAVGPTLEKASDYVSNLGRLGELADLDRDLKNRAEFVPPDSRELTEAQVQHFVRVQSRMRDGMGARMKEIETKYQGLSGDGARQPSVTEVFGGLSELAGLFVDARRYQVEALNAEGLSQSEYDWVKRHVYAAAGYEVVSKIDLRQIEQMARDGASRVGVEAPEVPPVPTPDVPPRNRELVKPHLSEMKNWLALAFFGY